MEDLVVYLYSENLFGKKKEKEKFSDIFIMVVTAIREKYPVPMVYDAKKNVNIPGKRLWPEEQEIQMIINDLQLTEKDIKTIWNEKKWQYKDNSTLYYIINQNQPIAFYDPNKHELVEGADLEKRKYGIMKYRLLSSFKNNTLNDYPCSKDDIENILGIEFEKMCVDDISNIWKNIGELEIEDESLGSQDFRYFSFKLFQRILFKVQIEYTKPKPTIRVFIKDESNFYIPQCNSTPK